MTRFFGVIGWPVHIQPPLTVVTSPGGRFGLAVRPAPPRLELALSVSDPLCVDELAGLVEHAGGIIMEPPQETIWGGWGFSFNFLGLELHFDFARHFDGRHTIGKSHAQFWIGETF